MEAQMKKIINVADATISFTFEGLETVTFDPRNAQEENRNYAMLHGFSQRFGDNAAISRKDGSVVTEAMRREAILEMVQHYESDSKDWNLKTSEKKAALNPVIQQIAAKLGITYEEAQAKVAEQFLNEI
jgi:hypothetical protein